MLFRPLPFRDAGRLVMVWERDKQFRPDPLEPDRNGLMTTSIPGLLDWRSETAVFEEVGAYYHFPTRLVLAGSKEPVETPVGTVTPNLFTVLGIQPILGRTFPAGSDRPGSNYLVILGYGLWQRRFGGDPHVIGRAVSVGPQVYTVVGVMPPGFEHPRGEQAWVPHVLGTNASGQSRNVRNLEVVARLKPGVSLDRARAALDVLAAKRGRQFPRSNARWGAAVVPLREHLVGGTRGRLLLLFGASAFVVLIACANLANMLLARGTARAREMAVRGVLGAGRGRLIRQTMVETLLLAVLGGAAGLALALWWTPVLVVLGSATVPQLAGVVPDWRVLAFALAASCLAGIVAGLPPSLRASKASINEALKEGATIQGGVRGGRRLGGLLVVSELAAALILLTGAGLMVHTLARLYNVDPGFRPQNLLTMRITLPRYKYAPSSSGSGAARARAFFDQALERVRALPGVRSAGLVDALPLSGVNWGTAVGVEGRLDEAFHTQTRTATVDYFGTLGIPLVRGRLFNEQDTDKTTPVAIVNDTLAREIWGDEDPIGRRIGWNDRAVQVVGVVGTVRHVGLDLPGGAEVYAPLAQSPSMEMFLAVRTIGNATALAPAVRQAVWSVDKDQPIEDMRTMDERIGTFAAPRRFYGMLLAVFAAIAVCLAAVGVYGVISYSVSQRRHEIGVRMALGAGRREVLGLVLRQGVSMSAIGIAAGIAGALAVTRLLSNLLYGVRAADPITFAAVSLLLGLVVLAACYVPARRAVRVDPLVALRWE